jgi:hypothetical protein
MATAKITATYHPDATPASVQAEVTYDALDSPEALEECVRNAAALWAVTQADDEAEEKP